MDAQISSLLRAAEYPMHERGERAHGAHAAVRLWRAHRAEPK
jgi:hypothetical protein